MTAASTPRPQAIPQTLVLDAILDFGGASDLAQTFNALRGAAILVDPSQVTRVGAPCAQVLISAVRTWSADGVAFSMMPGSTPFRDGLDLLGLAAFFKNPRAN